MNSTCHMDAPERATTGVLGPGLPVVENVVQVRVLTSQHTPSDRCFLILELKVLSSSAFIRVPVSSGLLHH